MISYVYFLKVIVCSIVLLGYYFIALRNKVYHHYNRIYLLFSIIASWIIPALSFNFLIEQDAVSSPIYSIINYASQHSNINELNTTEFFVNTKPNNISIQNIALVIFCIVSINFLFVLMTSFFKIYRLKKKYKAHKLDSCTIYLTNEKYTPYSFLDLIFWNQNIALDSKLGKQILEHELVHIKEKHSWDKIFIQVNLIVGWFNPFFWIIKAELEMIHEFIADKKSIPNGDVSEFANMILSVNQVNKSVPLTNPFFFSPIKRRLKMLGQKKSLKYSYLQKLLALPLLVSLIALLSFKTKQSFALAKQKKLLPEIIVNPPIARNNNDVVVKEKTKEALINTVNQTSINQTKDTVLKGIDELQNEFLQLEKQYKQEAAFAGERKKIMLLIQQQNLTDEQMLIFLKL